VTNMVGVIRTTLFEQLKPHVPALCFALEHSSEPIPKRALKSHIYFGENGITFSTYAVKQPFGFFRLCVVEVLTTLVLTNPYEVLDLTPPSTWRVLVNWFFEFSNNNLYQNAFYKLVASTIIHNHTTSLKALLTKQKFLSRLISHFQENNISGCKGYIILLCNIMRLGGDAHPNDFIQSYLLSHDAWKQFLPTLKEITCNIVERGWSASMDALQLPACIGTSFAKPPLSGSPSSNLNNLISDPNSIELGSIFARHLGFDPPAEIVPHEIVNDQQTKKKKRKKKKNKNKNNTNTNSNSPSSPVITSTDLVF